MEKAERGTLLVISGPSGAGKSTVISALMKERDNIYFSVSCTTRSPRPGEVHGINYFYLTNEEFERMIAGNGFLEHAGYVDHYYGTPAAEVEKNLAAGKDVILDIEVQGAAQVRANCPGAVLCFLIPPTFEELSRRLHGRQSETEEVIRDRLNRAKEEYCRIPEYDYLVINDVPERAAAELGAILDADKCRTARRMKIVEEM